MDEDQQYVAWSIILWNGGTPPRSGLGVACQGIGKIVTQRADLVGRRKHLDRHDALLAHDASSSVPPEQPQMSY